MLTLTFAAIAMVALLAHLSGRAIECSPGLAVRALEGRGVVAVVLAVTFMVLRLSAGSSKPMPVVQDEMAYVLQAQIFATGRWAATMPPIAAFWEQPQVLVQPAVAAKYFPGHALLLALGALAGCIAIVPLLLQTVAGALVFLLARRVAGSSVALLTWVIWLGSPMVLHYGASYFSETTTGLCWVAGWYALIRWREGRGRGWLAGLALAVGWCVVTRPLTGIAFAVPIGLLVLRDVARGRRWTDLGFAFAVGVTVLSIIPLWSARTTGHWRTTPLVLYTRQYRPYDVPGFGLDTTPPALAISPQMVQLNVADYSHHLAHHPATLPRALVTRWPPLSQMIWGSSGGALFLFALLGLLAMTPELAFALASSVALLLAHLSFAAPPPWTLYYYESVPPYALATGMGVAWAASQIGRPARRPWSASYGWRSTRWTAPLASGAALLLLASLGWAQWLAVAHRQMRQTQESFARIVQNVPGQRTVLFVRYHPDHNANVTYVRNSARLDQERVWVVRDMGATENARLLALSGGRTPWLFDETSGRVLPYAEHAR